MTQNHGIRLEVYDLAYAIRGVEVVHDLSFQVRPGQVLGLVGPNGAGKTTAVDLLSGFASPLRGRVLLSGQDITRWSPCRRVQAGLTRTFQESPGIPGLTVGEHLKLALEACGRRRRDGAPLDMNELLGRFALAASRDGDGAHLPTAPRRLLDLARAIATAPDVLLLDEPFAGLEPNQVAIAVGEIKRAQAGGAGIVVIEHRLALLNQVADSALALVSGVPVATGSLAEVLRNPRVMGAFLGVAGGGAPDAGRASTGVQGKGQAMSVSA